MSVWPRWPNKDICPFCWWTADDIIKVVNYNWSRRLLKTLMPYSCRCLVTSNSTLPQRWLIMGWYIFDNVQLYISRRLDSYLGIRKVSECFWNLYFWKYLEAMLLSGNTWAYKSQPGGRARAVSEECSAVSQPIVIDTLYIIYRPLKFNAVTIMRRLCLYTMRV